jgi:hypothetical protein
MKQLHHSLPSCSSLRWALPDLRQVDLSPLLDNRCRALPSRHHRRHFQPMSYHRNM